MKPKSNITSRLRENESKFIRQLEQKDQEIMELRKEVKELSKMPKNTQEPKTLHRGWGKKIAKNFWFMSQKISIKGAFNNYVNK